MSLCDAQDTIAAIASPPGAGLRGIVRLSGEDAWAIALSGFEPDRYEPLPARPALRLGRLRVDGLRPRLPAAIALWPAPRTYTRQPLAEIHTIGSPPLLRQILTHCLARGARRAEPGEFTLRAFLSGRLDLTEAEAVLGVIDARNPAQLDAALRQLAGGVSAPITSLRDRLLDVLAHLEANLDFADESDVDPLGRAALASELVAGSEAVAHIAGRLRGRDRPEDVPKVVLAGPPNAGKSRLFNALVGASRALVSPVAGTTRDYLSALVSCGGAMVELIDTAGIDEAGGTIEQAAQSLRTAQSAEADVVLFCEPAFGEGPEARFAVPVGPTSALHATPADEAIEAQTGRRPCSLAVTTKCDLGPSLPGSIATSAATGMGLDTLRLAIAQALGRQTADGELPSSTSARCHESLARAAEALDAAAKTVQLGGGDELVAVDIRQAVDELGKVVGATVTDDILDRIFRRFCIGK